MSGTRRYFYLLDITANPAILALCGCFSLAAVFSGTWAVLHADHVHDCDGVDGCCSVCARLADAWDALKQFGAAFGCEISAPVFFAAVLISVSALPGAR